MLKIKESIPKVVQNRYKDNETKEGEIKTKENSREAVLTPIEWTLQKVMKMRSEYGYFYPTLVSIVEIALSAPVTLMPGQKEEPVL
mgnify:CR=1 FL=1